MNMTSSIFTGWDEEVPPMTDVSDTLINVIDVWEVPETESEKYPILIEDASYFARFLNKKMIHYKTLGAHINFATHDGHEPHSELSPILTSEYFGNVMTSSEELLDYFNDNNLKRLVICGQHLHRCIMDRPTGYIRMKTYVPNIAVALTLCRAYPTELDKPFNIDVRHYIYL